MTRTHHQPGLLFNGAPCAGHRHTAAQISMQFLTSAESGTTPDLTPHKAQPALLRGNASIDAHKTKSLCCIAAGIIVPLSRHEKGRLPHERLRWAAPADTTLIASYRPHAQPAEGYKHGRSI